MDSKVKETEWFKLKGAIVQHLSIFASKNWSLILYSEITEFTPGATNLNLWVIMPHDQ